jgi:hypothetical protein
MTTERKVTIGISIAAAVLMGFAAIEVFGGPRSLLAGFDRGMQAASDFQATAPGFGKKFTPCVTPGSGWPKNGMTAPVYTRPTNHRTTKLQ